MVLGACTRTSAGLWLLANPQLMKATCFFYGGFSAWSQERKRAFRMALLVTRAHSQTC